MDKKIAICIVVIVVVVAALAVYAVSLDDDDDDKKEARDPTQLVEKEDKSSLGGWYTWNPYVLKVPSAYIAYSPSVVTALTDLFEGVYGELPEAEVSVDEIPAEYQTNYTSTVSGSYATGGVTFQNPYNLDTLKEETVTLTVTEKPGTIISYSATANDTLYYSLCVKYGETPYSGDTPKATAALWDMIYAGSNSATTKYEKSYGITCPDTVIRLGVETASLDVSLLMKTCYDACEKYGSCMVFMSDAIPGKLNADKLAALQEIVKNSRTTFCFFGSSSIGETLACAERISTLADLKDESKTVIEDAQLKIYSVKKAVDEYRTAGGTQLTVYMEAGSGKAAPQTSIIGSLFDILYWKNISTSEKTWVVLGDVEVVKAQPDIIVFYNEVTDSRTIDEQMRVSK